MDVLLKKLIQSIDSNEIKINLQKIEEAYDFVKKNLGNELRITGETHLQHSLKAALIISEIKADKDLIIGAMLHEVGFRLPEKLDEIGKIFGREIVELLKKTNFLGEIKFTKNVKLRENIKKMIIGISEDIKVVIIKLATFLEHLEASQTLPRDQQIELAKQGMMIYSPIADLLGIWNLRWKIEDTAFKILNPKEYDQIFNKFMIKKKKEQENYIKNLKNRLLKECQEKKINCVIEGRYKHIHSIYKKMKDKHKKFNEIYDVFALRVIVNDVAECYQTLGLIHSLWKPYLHRIKDYIAQPKPNGYQSLHTTVFGPGGILAEFQIRTKQMHDTAEFGIAAHWRYKNETNSIMENTRWVNDILKLKQKLFENSETTLDTKLDIFKSRIFVYTPKGDVIDLPENAVAIDFAYYIHSEIGKKCIGVVINGLEAKLNDPLKNNDVVEILTDETQKKPDPKWLKTVVSSHARRKINNQLNRKNA